MTGDDDLTYPSDRGAGDHAYELGVAATNAIPYVGGVLASVVESYWSPRLQRRRTEWLSQLAEDVETLAGEVGDLEAKLEDDTVLDVALQAATIADRTSSEEAPDATGGSAEYGAQD